MTFSRSIRLLVLVLPLIIAALAVPSAAGQPPAVGGDTAPLNVVFILADDLGWSDTTLYGTTRFYQTPNLLPALATGAGLVAPLHVRPQR